MFHRSLTIGRIAGIPIRIHVSLLVAYPFLAWLFGNQVVRLAEALGEPLAASPFTLGLVMVTGLFLSVALHELGHSLTALARGIGIKDITLMLFGGVAQLDEEFSHRPTDELVISLAGPAVSLVLVAVFYLGAAVVSYPDALVVLSYLAQLNLILALFNLLPAFPTDGGRVLRALLAKRLSPVAATRAAVTIGQGFSFLFVVAGLFTGNLFLVLIAVFIYMAAAQEYQATLFRQTLAGFLVKDLMTPNVTVVEANNTVGQLLEQMYRERHQGYPVVEHGQVVGCVTMEDITKVEPRLRDFTSIREIMSSCLRALSPKDDIYQVLKMMNQLQIGRLLVMEGGQLVGIITRSDILRGFQLRMLDQA